MSESPAKTIRPLELQSPNAYNIDRHDDSDLKSPPVVKGTPSSSSAPRMMPSMDEDDGENHGRDCCGRDYDSFRLSPIGRVDFSTPAVNTDVSETLNASRLNATNLEDDATRDDGLRINGCDDGIMDSSFPDNRDVEVHIHSPVAAMEEDEIEEDEAQETEEERMQREIEESEALARQLMAEEAMASYAMSTEYLRENADQFSSEDLAALQAAMAEEDLDVDEEGAVDGDVDEEGEDTQEMSYDALLRLGERIGDVKEERWALIAREKMDQLPTLSWAPSMAEGKEENHTEVKCQVCQFPYEEGDVLRRLPCGHCFHKDCVDSWLETKDTCAFCRKSIVDK